MSYADARRWGEIKQLQTVLPVEELAKKCLRLPEGDNYGLPALGHQLEVKSNGMVYTIPCPYFLLHFLGNSSTSVSVLNSAGLAFCSENIVSFPFIAHNH